MPKLILLFMVLLGGAAGAQPAFTGDAETQAQLKAALLPPAFEAWRDSDRYWDWMITAIRESEAGRPEPCLQIGDVELERTILHHPIAMAEDDANPREGIWQERLIGQRCGEPAIFNALFVANPGGPPDIRGLIQGDSAAVPGDQGDIAAVVAEEAARLSGCAEVQAVEARFERFVPRAEGDPNPYPLWAESWQAEGCGIRQGVLIVLDQQWHGRARIGIVENPDALPAESEGTGE